MNRSRRAQWSCLILLGALVAALAGCAPFSVQAPPSRFNSVAATAAASATYAATSAGAGSVAVLPAPHPDPGWVGEVEIANGSEFNGSGVVGGTPGSATAGFTSTFGYFKLSPATLIVMIFSCQSPAGVHSSVEVAVGESEYAVSDKIACAPTAPSTRDQFQMPASLVGHKLPVNVTVSTDSQPPQWNLLVEQPK